MVVIVVVMVVDQTLEIVSDCLCEKFEVPKVAKSKLYIFFFYSSHSQKFYESQKLQKKCHSADFLKGVQQSQKQKIKPSKKEGKLYFCHK